MLKKLLAGAALASVLVLSPLAGSAEPMPPNAPTADHEHMDHHGGDRERRHEWRHHEHHHHHHHHYHHHHDHG